jgi:magnesium chelatase family protein
MLAERYPSILPNLSPQESLDVTKIHSVAGLLPSDHPLINTRPFRAPHHSISEPALIGGGSDAKPGEISLAHHGVLFLDELPEFKRSTLEVLRQPLESSTISIGRSKRHCEYPANFTLVAAMNPCPCGYQGSRVKNCRCTSHQSERYLSKLSGPLLDRIDIHIEVSDQAPSKLRQSAPSTQSSEELKHQVQEAHRIQKSRYKNETISYNGDLRGGLVDKFCSIHDDAEKALIQGMENMGLSTRAFHKVLIVSRTIADLSASEDIHLDHICEALNYRVLDQKLFN